MAALQFPVYRNALDWSALEELLLIEGIELHGFGNWKQIATHVGTKSSDECDNHYHGVYLGHESSPLPLETSLMTVEDLAALESAKLRGDESVALALQSAARGVEGSGVGRKGESGVEGEEGEEGEMDGDMGLGLGTGEALLQEEGALLLATGGALRSGPADARPVPASAQEVEVGGYMPLRGDFDVEHDNDAELALADMEFREGEHPTETEMKLKVIEVYNARLDERERRKRFVIERGLLDYKSLQAAERRRSRAEREVRNQMRPFARFQTHEEHEALVEGLCLELRLRRRIERLQEYRALGIRTLAEAEDYETARKRRETQLALKKQRESSGYLFATTSAAAAAAASSSSATSSTGSASARKSRSERASRRAKAEAEAKKKSATSQAAASAASAATPSASSTPTPTTTTTTTTTPTTPASASAAASSSSSSSSSSSTAASTSSSSSSSTSPTHPTSISSLPPTSASTTPTPPRSSSTSLTPAETALATHLQLLPTQYEALKHTILSAAEKRAGKLTKREAILAATDRTAIPTPPLSPTATAKAAEATFDLVVSLGWVTAAGSVGTDKVEADAFTKVPPTLPDPTPTSSSSSSSSSAPSS